jgi:Na+-translocating ferredoxin:NAD+ oxidoreductase RnfG subunit
MPECWFSNTISSRRIAFCLSFAPTFRVISVQILDHRSPPGMSMQIGLSMVMIGRFLAFTVIRVVDCTGADQSLANRHIWVPSITI